MKLQVAVYMTICTLFWGFSFAVMKIMVAHVDPMQVLVLRWTLSALVFGALALAGKFKINFRSKCFKFAVLAGLMEPCIYAVMEIYGVDNMSASLAAIFIATIPCVTLLFGALLFRKKINPLNAAGIIIAFIGVIIATVFVPGFSISGSALGVIFMTVAVVAATFYAFFSAAASEEINAETVTFVMSVMGAILFNSVGLVRGNLVSAYTAAFTDWRVAAGILFLGMGCSVLSYFSLNKLLGLIDPTVANMIMSNLVTVVGVVGGILIAGDPWGAYTVIGMLITITGVVLSSKTIE